MTAVEQVTHREAWTPNRGGQARFMVSRAKVVAALAGYGAGKTKAGARKAVRLALENAGRDGLIVAPTWGLLQKVTLRSFFDKEAPLAGACPAQFVEEIFEGQRYILLKNGSRIYFGSADRPGSLEGTNLAWWWLDEGRLVKRAAWNVLVGRLRDVHAPKVQGIITSTPSAGWLQEEFGSQKPDREAVHFSTRENAANLPPGTIEDLERTYSAREARVLIEGEFGLLVGAVYEEFERKTHLVDWAYNPRFRTLEAWDFGFRWPAVLFVQYLPAGTPIPGRGAAPAGGAYVVFDEIMRDNVTTEVLAMEAKLRGYKVDRIYCDPAGDGTQSAVGLTDVSVLKDTRCSNGQPAIRWTTEPRFRHIPYGVNLLRGLLRNTRGEIRLFVARSLDKPKDRRGIVKSLEGYAYPEAKDGRPQGDEPLKDGVFDHCGDALRYLAIGEAVATGQAVETRQVR